jgi:hypothetical protein
MDTVKMEKMMEMVEVEVELIRNRLDSAVEAEKREARGLDSQE